MNSCTIGSIRPETRSVLDVAVVIPVYERNEPLRRAVESVMAQTEPVKEILVVDDGTEHTPAAEVLEGLTDRRLRLLFQPNLGVSTARNLGIKATKAEWVAFLDSDDSRRRMPSS